MRIGFCQFNPVFGEKQTNFEKVENLLHKIKGDLLVLPELFSTGYQFKDQEETELFAETVSGPTVTWAKAMAKKFGGYICGGFVEKDNGKVYNSAFLAGPDESVNIYRKIHLFGRETECFSIGDGEFEVYDIGKTKVGMMICFDWIFPESMRVLMLKGAQIICHPSNLVMPYCQEAMKTRCLENGIFAITANRIGTESRIENESLTFTGNSQITAPRGKVLYNAKQEQPEIKMIEIDPGLALTKQLNPFNNLLTDRIPEKYGALSRRRK